MPQIEPRYTEMKIPSKVSIEEQRIDACVAGPKSPKLRAMRLSSSKSVFIKLIWPSLFFARILASHADEATNRVNAIRIPAAGPVMKAQLGTDGVIHLLFQAAHGPQYAKSEDSGLTFSAPITIVNAAAQKPGLEFQAEDLAVGKDGRVHVAMSNNAWKLKLPEEE